MHVINENNPPAPTPQPSCGNLHALCTTNKKCGNLHALCNYAVTWANKKTDMR